jgi:hypothetical protein
MKQQILNLKKKLLIVELPEGANDIKPPIDRPYMMSYKLKGHRYQFSTIAKSVLVGKLTDITDITEEQFEQWVDEFTDLMDIEGNYRDYKDYIFRFNTAKESFFSYLEKEGIYFSNPLGGKSSEIDIIRASWVDNPITDEDRKVWAWQEAEQEVWKLENCYIFEIV